MMKKALPFLTLILISTVFVFMFGCKSATQSDILGKWKYIDVANPFNMDSIDITWDFYDGQNLRITRKNKVSATAPVTNVTYEYSIPSYDKINIWSASNSEEVEIYFIRTLNSEMLRIQKMEGNSVAVTAEFTKIQGN